MLQGSLIQFSHKYVAFSQCCYYVYKELPHKSTKPPKDPNDHISNISLKLIYDVMSIHPY